MQPAHTRNADPAKSKATHEETSAKVRQHTCQDQSWIAHKEQQTNGDDDGGDDADGGDDDGENRRVHCT